MTRVAVLIPVLARPHRVQPLLESLHASANEATLWPLFLATVGDEEEIEALKASDADFVRVPWPAGRGDYARKINCGADLAAEEGVDWLLLAADDLCFCPGWADAAIREGERHAKRVIGTMDDANPIVRHGLHATHSLIRVDYLEDGTIDEPGKLLHEGYDHNFCDTELVGTAKFRGEWVFARDSVVEHLHPFYRQAVESDATYAKGQAQTLEDSRLYEMRRPLWSS